MCHRGRTEGATQLYVCICHAVTRDEVKAEIASGARTEEEARKRPAAHPDLIVTSSEKGMGLPELRAAVLEAIG